MILKTIAVIHQMKILKCVLIYIGNALNQNLLARIRNVFQADGSAIMTMIATTAQMKKIVSIISAKMMHSSANLVIVS